VIGLLERTVSITLDAGIFIVSKRYLNPSTAWISCVGYDVSGQRPTNN
jgi:hypothetical protein